MSVVARLGSRTPAYRTGPESPTSLGSDAIDLVNVATGDDEYLDDWQRDVITAGLQTRPDGRWLALENAEILPRQNGKGTVLEVVELHGLFREPDCRLILHTAHEFKTALEAFNRIVQLIQGSDLLSDLVKRIRYTTGEEGIELKDGSRLKFLARSSGSGRGFTGDKIILDEAYNLDPKMMQALIPTLSARPNPQIWYASSAPQPPYSDGHGRVLDRSAVLRDICIRGRRGNSKSLTYFEWCADRSDAVDDPEAWRKANPGLGIRITEEFIAKELEIFENDIEGFAREMLGIWEEDPNEERHVIDVVKWESCKDRESRLIGRVRFAIAVSPDRDWSSIVAAAPSSIDGVHIEIVDRRPGADWLVDRVAQLQEKWGGEVGIVKGSPAWSLATKLEAKGVALKPLGTQEHAQACGEFYDAVEAHQIRHLGQPELDAAVSGADKRNYGDSWVWAPRSSLVEITSLSAATIAYWIRATPVESLPSPDIF